MSKPSYREMMWKTAVLSVLREHGFVYVDEFDLEIIYTDQVDLIVTLRDEKERFLYELKGSNKWLIAETKVVYNSMRQYLQEKGI
jgi:hypothetical protein